MRLVTLYYAPSCQLCEDAREVLVDVRRERAFTLREVDISGDEELELRHRIYLPVVEIEGGERFVHFLPEDEFRHALDAQTSASDRGL